MINKQMHPIITTIIPTYRRPKLLQRAIKSVLNQTYPYFQICIYDNASGDETASVVAEMAQNDPRIKYHCHSENLGQIKNLIYGMEHVVTPFFSILADDDLLLPNFYKDAISNLVKFPHAMFFGGSTLILENNRIIGINPKKLKSGLYEPQKGFKHLLRTHITWTSILFRTEVITEIGVLHPDSGVWPEFDYEFRISCRFSFYYSDEPCTIWECHPEYEHRKTTSYQKNWCTLIMLGGRQLKSKDMSRINRIYFFEWFLRNLTVSTVQLAEYYTNSKERSMIRRNIAYILKSNGIQGTYGFITMSYIYSLIIISPMAPLLRLLKNIFNSLFSNNKCGDPDSMFEKKYG